jgi:hypothetical protein
MRTTYPQTDAAPLIVLLGFAAVGSRMFQL